ncbi:MAG: hypothetical protein JRD93_19200 [Deltaproteobacteria bacterium]|nr:hypothetical protein [Deltaproteobacteria bacterium]
MVKKQKKIVLDEYEKEILEAYENGMLKPSKSQADYQKIARNTMKKNRKINIRISENDLSVSASMKVYILRRFEITNLFA